MTSSFLLIIAILFSQNFVLSPCKGKPNKTEVSFTLEKVKDCENVTISCEPEGLLKRNYTCKIRDINAFSTRSTYAIYKVKWNDAEKYKCVAEKLGNYSCFVNLTPSKDKRPSNDTAKNRTEWYIRAAILGSGIIIGILFSCIVWCSHRRWFRNRRPLRNRESQTTEVDTTFQELDLTEMNTEDDYQSLVNRKPESNFEPQETEADPTYQKLDLSKMNTEDNYQPLKLNAASNDAVSEDDASYTELSDGSDVESNYQSINV